MENLTEPLSKALDFISDIIKPPIKELSEILTDKVRYWRFKSQLTLIQNAEKYIKDKGFNPKKIPIKTLVPLLEYSSLEEDDSLKEMWTKLLVNSVDPSNQSTNQNVFIEVLKQMSPFDAKILFYFHNNTKPQTKLLQNLNFRSKFIFFNVLQLEFDSLELKELYLILENLSRLQLIEPQAPSQKGKGMIALFAIYREHYAYRLTYLGNELIEQTS